MNRFAKYFAIHGTDKLIHGYHTYYDKIISDKAITSVLEIGVKDGKSLLAWSDIWPDAKIEAMDLVEPSQSIMEKFKIHISPSMDSEYSSIEMDDDYDLIIDDAGHHWRDQLATFYNFYDKAQKFYAIEDIRGGYCLSRIIRELPAEVLMKATIFHSEMDLGKMNFVFTDNVENRTCHFIMIIDKTR